MKTIAVFTSGGDSPGMNACIRAVVRTAVYYNIKVKGIIGGYQGMIENDFIDLDVKSVANIIQRGGTILKTARSKDFMTLEGRQKALLNLKNQGIEGIVAIGGDGTFKGALEFSKISDIPIVGCPGTIDNDLAGTDFTIGYDTAINTVIEAVDKLRDTAESHNRVFVVEVMGRDAGRIALRSGIASGAEEIFIPETRSDLDNLIKKLSKGRKDKSSKIIMVAEGDEAGGAFQVSKFIKEKLPDLDIRVSILGHIQRGGSPTCMERVNASRMGFAAVEALKDGKNMIMIGIINMNIAYTPFEKAVKHIEAPHPDLLRMMDILSM
ncbi:MAG: 6-phosphofructokinase [Bacteroidia bacterium]